MTAPIGKDTAILLQDLYRIADMQAQLSEQNLSLEINWEALRGRLDQALVREGIEIPDAPEIKAEKLGS